MRKWLVFFFSVTLYLLSSCSINSTLPEYQDISGHTKYTILNFPAVNFDEVIWRTDGIVVAWQNEATRPLRQPYALEGEFVVRHLDLVSDDNCELTNYRFPTRLPDGRLGLIKWCVMLNTFEDRSYLVAYDWQTNELNQIVQNPLKHFDIAKCFGWNPTMTKGIQSVSNGLLGTLNWLTPIGPQPFDITLRDGNQVWDLAKDFETNGSVEGGRVSCPTWSPKGDEIAVFISFDAMDVEGIARLDEQSSLVLIYPETGQSKNILSGIFLPESLEWSPDGTKLAFLSSLEKNLDGIWVYNFQDSSLNLIAKDVYFKDLSWSPNSQNLAVIWCDALLCKGKSEIRKYSIP